MPSAPLHKFTEPQLALIKRIAHRGGVRPEKGDYAIITALKRAGLLNEPKHAARASDFTEKMEALLLATFPRYHVDLIHMDGILFAPGLRVMCIRTLPHGQRTLAGLPKEDLTTPLQIIADLLNKEARL